MSRLLAWLKRQFAPTVPPCLPRTPVDAPTPPPRTRFVARGLCPWCSVLVWEGERHDCATPRV